LQPYRSVIAEKQLQKQHNIAITKTSSKRSMPQKKKSTQKHCRVPKSQIQTKK
jgi:hypothetical protein